MSERKTYTGKRGYLTSPEDSNNSSTSLAPSEEDSGSIWEPSEPLEDS